jgi:1,4-dihydroxy-2-naphthoyl-CoA synthase
VVSFVPVSIIEGENMSRFIEIKQNGKIIEVVLCRPETYNAFNLEMITELAKHLTRLATDGFLERKNKSKRNIAV